MAGFNVDVQIDDETAELLTKRYSDERISQELQELLTTMAHRPDAKQEELRRNMSLPEEPPPEEDKLSDEELNEEIRRYIRGKRDTDPRLE